MSDGREAAAAHLDALMYRMLGQLLLLGAAVLLGLAAVLLCLPRIETASGGALVLPGMGGRHVIGAAALPILGLGAVLMGGPGVLALGLGRRRARFMIPVARSPGRRRSMRRPVAVLCGGVALLALVLLRR